MVNCRPMAANVTTPKSSLGSGCIDRRRCYSPTKRRSTMLTGLALAVALGADPTVALGTGPKMCVALTAADFTAVGLSPDPTPPRPPNSDEKTGAYCTYTKAFPVAGGL